jgi:nucleoside-diphosphate-sugar epimerase
MKRILVTGASGFVGRHVLQQLEPQGFEIHTAGRSLASLLPPSVTHHQCSLLDPETPGSLVSRIQPTHLLHLAWSAEAGSFWHSPLNLKWLSTTVRLFEAFIDCGGRRIVGAGSCAEYDWSSAGTFSEADLAGAPSTLYGKTKKAAGEYLLALESGTAVSAAWGRLFFLYGPGGHAARIPAVIIDSLLDGQLTPCPAGKEIRDYLFVRDAAAALVRLLESHVSGPVNIASGNEIRVIELIQAAAESTGNSGLLRPGQSPSHTANNPTRIVADVTRLHQELGFRPQISLSSGMAETVAWLRNSRIKRAA